VKGLGLCFHLVIGNVIDPGRKEPVRHIDGENVKQTFNFRSVQVIGKIPFEQFFIGVNRKVECLLQLNDLSAERVGFAKRYAEIMNGVPSLGNHANDYLPKGHAGFAFFYQYVQDGCKPIEFICGRSVLVDLSQHFCINILIVWQVHASNIRKNVVWQVHASNIRKNAVWQVHASNKNVTGGTSVRHFHFSKT
jgi:hypothetical protein